MIFSNSWPNSNFSMVEYSLIITHYWPLKHRKWNETPTRAPQQSILRNELFHVLNTGMCNGWSSQQDHRPPSLYVSFFRWFSFTHTCVTELRNWVTYLLEREWVCWCISVARKGRGNDPWLRYRERASHGICIKENDVSAHFDVHVFCQEFKKCII